MNIWKCDEPGCKCVAYGVGAGTSLRALGWSVTVGTIINPFPIILCPAHRDGPPKAAKTFKVGKLLGFVMDSPLWKEQKAYKLSIGWGRYNGYLAIPKGHPLYNMDYNDIEEKYTTVRVHGGLTYSGFDLISQPEEVKKQGMYIIGFDSAHSGDTEAKWPRKAVIAELKRLEASITKALKK